MITRREAERLCKSFLGDNAPPKLPENFAFEVRKQPPYHSSKGEFAAKQGPDLNVPAVGHLEGRAFLGLDPFCRIKYVKMLFC